MTPEMNNHPVDRQIRSLGEKIGTEGVAPARDLWPEIDAALDASPRRARQLGNWPPLWRLSALAASLALILGLGYLGSMGSDQPGLDQANQEQANSLALAANEIQEPSALERLDKTLGDLNDAMSLDPDNMNLSRLVLLVHKSRADILRQNTQGLNL